MEIKHIQQQIILLLKLAYGATNATATSNALLEANQQITVLEQLLQVESAGPQPELSKFVETAFNVNLQLLKGLDQLTLQPVDQVRNGIRQLERAL